MNDFITKANCTYLYKKSYVICDDGINLNMKTLKDEIDKDFPPTNIKSNRRYRVVYCYSLLDGKFQYPGGTSNVLYIGKSKSEINNKKISLSFRFKHCVEGYDSKSNYSLRYYFKSKVPLVLEIYVIDDEQVMNKMESRLRKRFVNQYAAYPIADGASFKKK